MSDTFADQSRLRTELAQLRAALRAVEAPAPDEGALRAAFREARRQPAELTVVAPGRGGSRRLHIAAAAAVVLGVAAVLGTVLTNVERPGPEPSAAAAPAEQLPPTAFQPLLNSPGFLPAASYSVVRVRIPLASFAVVPGTEQGGTIEADLLVGEDGLARGIRFGQADAALLAAAQR